MISVTKLDAVHGNTNVFDFAYSGDPLLTVLFTVRSGSKIILSKDLSDGIGLIDEGYRVTLQPADTSDLERVLHVFTFDLRATTALGVVTTLFQGPIYIFSNVT